MAFSYKQRKDGGFDFFNADKKTTIEDYVKNTGANQGSLRTMMAQKGDQQSQRIAGTLPTQFSASNKPGLTIKTPTLNPVATLRPTSTPVAPINQPRAFTAPLTAPVLQKQATLQSNRPQMARPQQLQIAKPQIQSSLAVAPTQRSQWEQEKFDRLEPLFKQNKSFEDMAKVGGYSNDEVRKYAEANHKNYGDQGIIGNTLNGVGGYVGTMAKNAAGIVTKPVADLTVDKNSVQNELMDINTKFQNGSISEAAAMERANEIANRFTNKSVRVENGWITVKTGNIAEFGGKFAQQGIDTGSVLPIAGGVAMGTSRALSRVGTGVASRAFANVGSLLTAGTSAVPSRLSGALANRGMSQGTSELLGNAITSNAKQSLVYGTAQTGSDVLNGRGITPESLALNYGADFAMGALPEIAIGGLGRGIHAGIDAIPTPQKLTIAHPEVLELKAKADDLFAHRQSLMDRGLASQSAPVKEVDNAIKSVGAEYNRVYKQVFGESQRKLEGGYARIPGQNGDGKPMSIDDPTAALKAEALKYKTAEEFVNSQERLYKGLKTDGTSHSQSYGDAIYASPYEHIAKTYDSGGGVVDMYLKPGSKTINWQDPEYVAIRNKFMEDNGKGYRNPNYNKINAELKKRGYDAVTFSTDGTPSPQTAILNKEAIQTKQQLADVWKQANKNSSLANSPTAKVAQKLPVKQGLRANQSALDSLTDGLPYSDRNSIIPRKQQLTDLYNQAHTPQPKPEVAQAKATVSVEPKQPQVGKTLKDGELYSTANSYVSFGSDSTGGVISYNPKGTGSVPERISYNKLSQKTRDELVSAELEYKNARANSTSPVAPGTVTETQIAKGRLELAQSNAIEELGLQEHASIQGARLADGTKPTVQKPFLDRYTDWLESKWKSKEYSDAQIQDMEANPSKYKAQFESETAPKNTANPTTGFAPNTPASSPEISRLQQRVDAARADLNNPQVDSRFAHEQLAKAQRELAQAHTPQPKPEVAQGKVEAPTETISTKSSTGDVKRVGSVVQKNTTFKNGGRETLEGEIYGKLSGTDGIAQGKVVDTPQGKKIETPIYSQVISVDSLPKDQRWKAKTILESNFDRINKSVSDLTNAGYEYNDPLQFGYKDGKVDLMDFSNSMKADPDTAFNANMAALSRFYSEFGADKYANIIDEVSSTRNAYKATQGVKIGFGDAGIYDKHPELLKQTYVDPNNVYIATNGRDIMLPGITQTTTKDGLKLIFSDKPLSAKDIYDWEMKPIHQAAPEVAQPKPVAQAKVEAPKATSENPYILPGGKAKTPTEIALDKKLDALNQQSLEAFNKGDKLNGLLLAEKRDIELAKSRGETYKRSPNLDKQMLEAKTEAPQVGKTPKQPTPFEKSLEQAGIVPKKTEVAAPFEKNLEKAGLAPTQATQPRASQTVAPKGYTASIAKPVQKTQGIKSQQNKSAKKVSPQKSLEAVQKPQKDTQTPSPDNTAQKNLPYTDDTPPIDTKQYIKQMNKEQGVAGKGKFSAGEKVADFKEKFIDDLSPIEDRLNKAIKSGAEIDPKDHITYQLDRSRRSEGITQAYMNDNDLSKIIQEVPNPKEFDQYLIARHAKELDPEITTGRDKVKDAALVKQLDGKYGEYAKRVYTYNQKLLDTAVEYGLISKDLAASLKKQYPEYVPFNRIFKEDELGMIQGNGKGNASISTQGVVKKLEGSKRSVRSPLNSIIDKTRVVVEQGERNKAAQMLASYKDLPENPFNLKEIKANETIGNRSTIAFLENGKKRVFEVDKEIADAAKNMNRQDIGLWGRIAAVPARVLRAGATGVNAGFAGANVVKDIIGAAINSKHPIRIADPRAMGKALAAALNHKGKFYQELMREGVAGTSFDMYRNPLKSNIGEVRSQKNIGTRSIYNFTHPKQWYRTLENAIGRSEDFGRALQYYSNKSGFLAEGKNATDAKILAADQARNNSTNFFRHGSYGKGINLAIPYWNAGVQGARIQTRRIAERPVQTLAKIGLVIAAPSAMIAVNNYSDEKKRKVMDDIEDYEKEGNIIIVGNDAKFNEKTGRWEGVYKIPVPPQHLGIHKSIQDAVKSAYTGADYDIMGNLGKVAENYTTIDPTDGRAIANKYTPQGVKLIAEPMTNTNFFTGNKIVPDSQKNLPAADQFGDYTSGTAKAIGKLTNTSPRMIDNAIKTGGGGVGRSVTKAIDDTIAAKGASNKTWASADALLLDPVTKRFSGAQALSPGSKAEKQFEQMKKEVVGSDAYKNASQYDKSRMLNRLQGDLEAVAWNESGKSSDKLTKKQTALATDGFKLDTYTNLESSAKNSSKSDTGWMDEYNAAAKDFSENSKNWTEIQRIGKEKELKTLEVKKNFSKDATRLYDMAEKDIYAYLDKSDDKKASDYLNQVVAYGDKMVEAGLWTTNKLRDKNGNIQYKRGYTASTGSSRKTSSRKSGTSKASIASILASNKSINDLNNSTYLELNRLLTGVSKKRSQPKTLGRKVALKKISSKGERA